MSDFIVSDLPHLAQLLHEPRYLSPTLPSYVAKRQQRPLAEETYDLRVSYVAMSRDTLREMIKHTPDYMNYVENFPYIRDAAAAVKVAGVPVAFDDSMTLGRARLLHDRD